MEVRDQKEDLELWRKKLVEVDMFYAVHTLPPGPIKLSVCETIVDPQRFVEQHLSIVKENLGLPTFKPYMRRLLKFKEILTAAPASKG